MEIRALKSKEQRDKSNQDVHEARLKKMTKTALDTMSRARPRHKSRSRHRHRLTTRPRLGRDLAETRPPKQIEMDQHMDYSLGFVYFQKDSRLGFSYSSQSP